MACGLALSQEMLIVARAVQGVGGAVVSAVALSLIMNLFPDGPERVKAMGYFGFVMAGGGSVGVLLGGLLTGLLDWRSIFLVNLPIGALVLYLSLRLLPDGKGEGSRHLDVAGAVTITTSLLLAVYAVVNGEQAGWTSRQTLGLTGAAVALLLIFVAIEFEREGAAGAAGSVQAAQHIGIEHHRRAVGGGDVRMVLPVGALYAAGAAAIAPCRSASPSCRPT